MIDYDILQTSLLKAMDIEIREAEEYLKDRSYAPTPEFEEVMHKLLSDQTFDRDSFQLKSGLFFH